MSLLGRISMLRLAWRCAALPGDQPYEDMIYALSDRGIIVKVIYDGRHYLAVIQRKPGALRNGAPFTEMPDTFRRLQDHMLRKEDGDREMVDILSLVLHHDESAVLRAVELALESGLLTKTHILNLLHSLIDPRAPRFLTISRR